MTIVRLGFTVCRAKLYKKYAVGLITNGEVRLQILSIIISLCDIFSMAENPKLFWSEIDQKLILNPCINISSFGQLLIDAKHIKIDKSTSINTHVLLKK